MRRKPRRRLLVSLVPGRHHLVRLPAAAGLLPCRLGHRGSPVFHDAVLPGDRRRGALHQARDALPPSGVSPRARHDHRATGGRSGRLPGGDGGAPRLGGPPAGGLLRARGGVPLRRLRARRREAGRRARLLASPRGVRTRGCRPRRRHGRRAVPGGARVCPVVDPWRRRRRRRRRRRQRRGLGLRHGVVVPPPGTGGLSVPGMVRAAGADLLGADAVHVIHPLLRSGRGGVGGVRSRPGARIAPVDLGRHLALRALRRFRSVPAARLRPDVPHRPVLQSLPGAVDDLQPAAAVPRLPRGGGARRAAGRARGRRGRGEACCRVEEERGGFGCRRGYHVAAPAHDRRGAVDPLGRARPRCARRSLGAQCAPSPGRGGSSRSGPVTGHPGRTSLAAAAEPGPRHDRAAPRSRRSGAAPLPGRGTVDRPPRWRRDSG